MKNQMQKIPFSPDELKKVGIYETCSKLNTPITPKENMLRAIHHDNPLWIPLRADQVDFLPSVMPDNVARAFVREATPYTGPVGGKDMFGVEWEYMPEVGGCMVRPGHPLLEDVNDWKEVLHFPDVDSWDWESSAKENACYKTDDRFVVSCIFTGFYERLISFMEFENAIVALVDEDQKDAVHELFQALVELYKKILYKLKYHFNIDAVFLHDDWGGQKNSFFSPNTCREMIAPYIKQVVDYCHSIGVIFDFHSCGKIENMLPVMIECGIDKWGGQPINDKAKLVELYGDKILIASTDDISPVPGEPEPTPEEYARRVDLHMKKYGAGLPDKLFFLMTRDCKDGTLIPFYEAGRKLLCGTSENA